MTGIGRTGPEREARTMRLIGRRPGLIIPIGLVAIAVVAFTLLNRPTTAALKNSDPAAGSTVDAPPSQITLTFNVPVAQAHLTVTGADAATAASVNGKVATQPLSGVTAGPHTVSWHVFLRGGGELSGTLAFTVRTGAPVS
jgi:methionine-rich copper-binding protein CopC